MRVAELITYAELHAGCHMTMVKAVSLLKPMKSLQVNVFISTIWAEAEPTLMRAMTNAILKIKRM